MPGSRAGTSDLGETSTTTALIVIGKTSLADKLAKATASASKTIEKRLNVDTKN
jgi:hypothetical protein